MLVMSTLYNWFMDDEYGFGDADGPLCSVRVPVDPDHEAFDENTEAAAQLFRDEFGVEPVLEYTRDGLFEIVAVPDDVSHDHDIHEMNVALIADLYDRIERLRDGWDV